MQHDPYQWYRLGYQLLVLGLVDLGEGGVANIGQESDFWTDNNVSMDDELGVSEALDDNDYHAHLLRISHGGFTKG